ncbi:MAG TPA: endonuclease/exonuclease/phosphatase family protein [Pyrinomonadaceae bacterium]|nr:endonuclease/exonuclease/phosphatase family protein [Pyrinomonadaceae bacterium]
MATPEFIQTAQTEFGEAVLPQTTTPPTLTIASYNIRYAVGRFLIASGILRKVGVNVPSNRSQAIAENIRLAARVLSDGVRLPRADIIALQEADKGTARAGGRHVTRELAELLQMAWVHVSAGIPRGIEPKDRQWWLNFEEQIGLHDGGDTGVSLLTRFPMEDITRIDLPWNDCPWRPRLSVGATITVGGKALRIFNSHIDPHTSVNGQLDQVEVVLKHAERFRGPTMVLGDFNTLSRRKCIDTRRLLQERGFTTPFPTGTPTWRGAGLRLHADWVFVRDVNVIRWGVGRGITVSDHWPIWVQIAMRDVS